MLIVSNENVATVKARNLGTLKASKDQKGETDKVIKPAKNKVACSIRTLFFMI
jgi:hypothetical protein